ncbi:hypothetical protein Tco_0245729 [Tanacetum coccineum]
MSLGKLMPPWHKILDQKNAWGPLSLGIIAGECFPIDPSPSTLPQRQVAGDLFPHRNVAGESVQMLLGNGVIVVVNGQLFNIKILLCEQLIRLGVPPKKCSGDDDLGVPSVGEGEGDGESTNELQRWFYSGGDSGFATGFWIVCSALLLNR